MVVAPPEARFFRDAAGLVSLAGAVKRLPPSVPLEPFRAWVPSGSTGDDAYSAAMALLEVLRGRPLRLFATARDAAVISRARRAVFSERSMTKTVSAERRARFFRREGDVLRVERAVTGCCVFAVHDLAENLPFVRLDAVYCPMPMDGWTAAVRARALDLFHYALKPGGLLLLCGGSELGDPRFKRVAGSARLYTRSGSVSTLKSRDLQKLLGRAAAALRTEIHGKDHSTAAADSRQLQDEFVSMVSHELSTPLAAILGYTETLRRGVRDPRRAKQFLGTIEKNARRLMVTIESLVGMADSRSLERRPQLVALAPVVRATAALLREKARRAAVSVSVNVAPEVSALIDPADLPHVLENLVGNAIKYNRRGGKVVVSAQGVGREIVLSVSDTGPGISPEALTRVFDRFYRAAETRHIKGTGLGLAIARGLVEANGGRLTVESEIGRGSTFRVALPTA